MLKKLLILVLVSCILSSLFTGIVFAEEEAILFPDSALESAVRDKIEKPIGDIYFSDVSGIKSFSASIKNIINIEGLQYFINVEYLHLEFNNISDLSPLSNLINLRGLSLQNNNISDLSPLSNLINLHGLDLCNNNISDLAPISNNINLSDLYLNNNEIFDLSPLIDYWDLYLLEVADNQISDISVFNDISLNNLMEIDLGGNMISDFTPLSNLQNTDCFIKIVLSGCNMSDISVFENLSNLEYISYVDLSDNNIVDISPLKDCKIDELDVSNNLIEDINILDEGQILNDISVLIASGNLIRDVNVFKNVDSLLELDLTNNHITDYSPLYSIYENPTNISCDSDFNLVPFSYRTSIKNKLFVSKLIVIKRIFEKTII